MTADEFLRATAGGHRVISEILGRCDVCGVPSHGVVWGFRVCVRCAASMNSNAPVGECLGLAFLFAACILFSKARAPWVK